ncbi:MAG: ABC transporter ATP-binding protein [Candidatus Omnitrophica bacterium]|nr:ABC transporter ATP-binding protein [Candidatus Omnitrophota bacterium]
MSANNKAIEIRDLHYSYPDGTQALRDINLDVLKGESVGIIGPNGAGKSTLLLHLNGILRGSGKIKVMGTEIQDSTLPLVRSRIGLVFQDPDNQLFMPTVFDDVAFGPINMMLPKKEVDAFVKQALAQVGMSDAIERTSHHLSFGEKKRVSIASVLSMRPDILVLDEPSSNLDPKGRKELIALLKGINKTKIIASHDLELVTALCSRYIFLDKGALVKENSTPQDLADLF